MTNKEDKNLINKDLKPTCTIRKNRTKKFPLMPSKVMKNTTERGVINYRFDNSSKILIMIVFLFMLQKITLQYSKVLRQFYIRNSSKKTFQDK